MTISRLNIMSAIYILIIILTMTNYPLYCEKNLQQEILAKKESEMLNWLDMVTLFVCSEFIISPKDKHYI